MGPPLFNKWDTQQNLKWGLGGTADIIQKSGNLWCIKSFQKFTYATQSQYWSQPKVGTAWKGPCATLAQNTAVLDMGIFNSLLRKKTKALQTSV